MGSLVENGVVIALDGNGVTFRQKNGAMRHTTDRPNNSDLIQKIEQARQGITSGSLTAEILEEKMRWVLDAKKRPFRDEWKIYRKDSLDQWQEAPVPRVPVRWLGADLPLGRAFAEFCVKKYFEAFELDERMAAEIKGLAEAGYPPTIFTGIPQFGKWGIREMLDPVWKHLNPEAAVVMTPNHGNTGGKLKTVFTGIASAAYPVLVKDDDPYVNAKLAPWAEHVWSPLSKKEAYRIAEKSYENTRYPDFYYSGLDNVRFDAAGGEILAYLCKRT